MRGGWAYIMVNRPFGSLYVGVTSDIARRAWEHRTGTDSGLTKRYRLRMLVYMEWREDIVATDGRDKPGHNGTGTLRHHSNRHEIEPRGP